MELKDLRKKKGLTQKEAADFLGVPLRTYVDYEHLDERKGTVKYKYMMATLSRYGYVDEHNGLLSLESIFSQSSQVFDHYGIEYAYLYGDYATKKATEESHVEMLISSVEAPFTLSEVNASLFEALKKKIDLRVEKDLKSDFRLTKRLLREGMKLYDANGLILYPFEQEKPKKRVEKKEKEPAPSSAKKSIERYVSIVDANSPLSSLTFKLLRIYLSEAATSEVDFEKLGLKTKDGEYNYLAYLLSDQNEYPIRIKRYDGGKTPKLIEAKDFGSNCVFKLIDDSFDYLKLCVELPLGVRVSAIKIGDRALEDAIWRSLVCIVLNNDYSFQDGMEIRVYPDRLEFAFKAVSARIERSKGNWYLSGVSTNGQLQDTFYKTHPDETGHLSSITEYMKGGPAAIAINENDFSVITLKLPEDANLSIEDTQNGSDKENDKENIPANLGRNVKNSHAAVDAGDNDNLNDTYNPVDYISSKSGNDNVKNSLDKEGDNEKFSENLIPDGVILSDKEKRVFEVIADNPYLTRNEIMERTAIPPATLSRAVKHLKDLKLVNRVGSDKNGYWEITAGSSNPLHK